MRLSFDGNLQYHIISCVVQGRSTLQDVLQLITIKKQWDLDATYTITTKEVIIRPPVFHSPLETIVLICVLMEV